MPTIKTKNNLFILTLKFILLDVVWDLLYWPLWWYTVGLKKFCLVIGTEITSLEHRLGLKVWIQNMFRPMFGQSDWQGRLISFFMRLIVLIGRSFAFGLWTVILVLILVCWVIGLPYAVYQSGTIIFHLLTFG